MNVATVKQAIQAQRMLTIRKVAASPEPLIPLDIRWALIKRAAQLRVSKLANCSREQRRAVVFDTIRCGLDRDRKIASHDPRMLTAELEACRKIGGFMQQQGVKEAFIGSLIGKGIGALGRGAMSKPGLAFGGLAAGAGLSNGGRLSQIGSSIGGRMMNAYNSLFNPSAVQTPQEMSRLGIGGQPPARLPGPAANRPAPQAPAVNPYEADFNTMTMADYMKHRQMLQSRLGQMDQLYPGFAPQQPSIVVAPPAASKPLAYNPNGNIPRYYGLGG